MVVAVGVDVVDVAVEEVDAVVDWSIGDAMHSKVFGAEKEEEEEEEEEAAEERKEEDEKEEVNGDSFCSWAMKKSISL